jgi:hypothetical protein
MQLLPGVAVVPKARTGDLQSVLRHGRYAGCGATRPIVKIRRLSHLLKFRC